MTKIFETDITIIGAGPVGLFAIFQCGMLGMKCHVIDSLPQIGGQCSELYPQKPIYDIPGFPKINATDLVDNLAKQAEKFEPCYHLNQFATEMIGNAEVGFTITTDKSVSIKSKAVFIAAGSGAFKYNRPPIPNINEFENKSVFYSVKDKNMFTRKKLAIAGGGDSAVDWAVELSQIAEKIYIIHRRNKFRASQSSIQEMQKLAEQGRIEIITPCQLKDIKGQNGIISSIIISEEDGNDKEIETDYLLAFYGLATDMGSIANWGITTEKGHIVTTQKNSSCNIKGVYAMGDVAQYEGKIKLILTGFAETSQAAYDAYNIVFPDKALHFEYSTTKTSTFKTPYVDK